MSGIGDRMRAVKARWFVIALLLALASALVPALCSHGLASSRPVGSAFDPTTSLVALRTQAKAMIRSDVAMPDADNDTASPILIMALPATPPTVQTMPARCYPALQGASRSASQAMLRETILAQPRAPPFLTV